MPFRRPFPARRFGLDHQPEPAGGFFRPPQPRAGAGGEAARHQPGAIGGALVRPQHMAMADAALAGRHLGDLVTLQQPVHSRPPDAAPHQPRLTRIERQQPVHGDDARRCQPPLHVAANAGNIRQFEQRQPRCQSLGRQDGQAIGFLHVGRHLGEQPVGRHADRSGQAFADIGAKARLDPRRQRRNTGDAVFVIEQPAGNFIDRADGGDRHMALHLGDDAVVIFDIGAVPGRHDDDVAAQGAGLVDFGAGADAIGLGFVTCGNGAGRIAVDRRHNDGFAAQGRVQLLFDAGKIAVEIEIQPTK